MPKYVKCDRCGKEYHDSESVEEVVNTEEMWKEMCCDDDDIGRGLAPCPILSCEGEMFLF